MIGIKQISEFTCRALCYFLLIDATDRKKLAAIEFDFFWTQSDPLLFFTNTPFKLSVSWIAGD